MSAGKRQPPRRGHGEPSCEEFRRLIAERFEAAPGDAGEARLEAHLESCAQCRAELAGLRTVDALIGRWASRQAASLYGGEGSNRRGEPVDRPVALEAARVAIEARRRSRGRRRWILTSVAAAAALAIASLALLWPGGGPAETEELLIIENLEVLEELEELEGLAAGEEEAGELTTELVDLILEDVQGGDAFDPDLFDYILEEEIVPEKL